MRVFSRARVLLTFMSQESSSSGSHILTMGTLADETQTTFCIPSAGYVNGRGRCVGGGRRAYAWPTTLPTYRHPRVPSTVL